MDKLALIGLGNPGDKYKFTPHNIGFLFLDYFCLRYDFPCKQKKYNGVYGETDIDKKKIFFFKPMTYMNQSGQPVSALIKQEGLTAKQFWIIHDEVDLAPGNWNLKKGGGHRGHNGLRDIMQKLGHGEFERYRIGVGRPDDFDLAAYLLRNFHPEVFAAIESIFAELAETIYRRLTT